jgi:hypothetical protein
MKFTGDGKIAKYKILQMLCLLASAKAAKFLKIKQYVKNSSQNDQKNRQKLGDSQWEPSFESRPTVSWAVHGRFLQKLSL